MGEYLERFKGLREPEQKQVLAAAQWGDGPYTRMIFKQHFPKLKPEDISALISHFKSIKL